MSRLSSTSLRCVDEPTVEITPTFLADLVPCISPLSSTAVSSLLSQASLVTLPPKRVLYRESDDARYTYIVLDGFVGVFVEGIQRLIHVRNLLESEALGGAAALTHLSNHERKRRKERKRSQGIIGSAHASAAAVGALALQEGQTHLSRTVSPHFRAAHTSTNAQPAQPPHIDPRQLSRPSSTRSRNTRPRPHTPTHIHASAQATSESELTTATAAAVPVPGMLSYLSPNPFPAHAPSAAPTTSRSVAGASAPFPGPHPPTAALPMRPLPPSHPRPATARPVTASTPATRPSRAPTAPTPTDTSSTATAAAVDPDTANPIASSAPERRPATTPLPLVQHGLPARLPTSHAALVHQPYLPRGLSMELAADHERTNSRVNQPLQSHHEESVCAGCDRRSEGPSRDVTSGDSDGACAPGDGHGLLVPVPSLLDATMVPLINTYDAPIADTLHASSRDHALSHSASSTSTHAHAAGALTVSLMSPVSVLQPSSAPRIASQHEDAHAYAHNGHLARAGHDTAGDAAAASALAGGAAVAADATAPGDVSVGDPASSPAADTAGNHSPSADALSPPARTPRVSLRALASPRRSLLSPRTPAQALSPRPSKDHALNTPRASAARRGGPSPRGSTLTPRGSTLTPRASLVQAQTPRQGGDAPHSRTHTPRSARSHPGHTPTPPATPSSASPRPRPRQSPRPSLSRKASSPFPHAPSAPMPALFTRTLRRQRLPPRPPSPLPSPSLPTRKTRPRPRYAPLPSLPARAAADASATVEPAASDIALADGAALTEAPAADASATSRLGYIPTGAALPPAVRAAMPPDLSPATPPHVRTPRLSLRSVPRLGSSTPSPHAPTPASPPAPPTRTATGPKHVQLRLLDLFASPLAPLFPTSLVTVQDLADTRTPTPVSSAPVVLSLRVGTRIYHVHRVAPLDAAPPPSPRALHAPLLAALPARARAALQGFLRRLTRIHARPRLHADAQVRQTQGPVADALSQRPLAAAARALAAPRAATAQPSRSVPQPRSQDSTAGAHPLQVPPGAPVGLTVGALTTLLQDVSLPALMRALSVLEPSAAAQADDGERSAALRLVSDPFVAALLSGIHQRAPAAQALKASGLLQHFLRHGIDPASVFRAVSLSDTTGGVSVGSQEASVPLLPQPTAQPLSAFADLTRSIPTAALAVPLPAQRQRYKQLLAQRHAHANALPDADGGLSRALEAVGTPDGPDLRSVLLRYLALQRAGATRSHRPQRGGRDVLVSLLSRMGQHDHASLYSAFRTQPSRTNGAMALLQREAEFADWRGREQSRAVHRIRAHRADMAVRSRKHAVVFRDLAALLQQHRHRLVHPSQSRAQADTLASANDHPQHRAQASPPARRRADLWVRMGVAVVLDALAAHNTRVRQSMSARSATTRAGPFLASAAPGAAGSSCPDANTRAGQHAGTVPNTNKPTHAPSTTAKKRRALSSLSLVLLRVLRETKPLLLRPKAKCTASALANTPAAPRSVTAGPSRPPTGTHASPSTAAPASAHTATLASLRADHALIASRDLSDAPRPRSPAPSTTSTSLVLPSALCVRVEPFSPTASAPSSATSAAPLIATLQGPDTSSTAPPASSRLRVSRPDYLEDDTLSPLPVFATSTRANGAFPAHTRTLATAPLPSPHTATLPALASPLLASLPAPHFPYSHLPRSPAAAEVTRVAASGTPVAPLTVDTQSPHAPHPYLPRPAPLSIPASASSLSSTASPRAFADDAVPSPTWSFSIPPSPSSRLLPSPSRGRLPTMLATPHGAHTTSRPMPKPASPTASRAPSRAASASRTRSPRAPSPSSRSSFASSQPAPSPRASASAHSFSDTMVLPTGSFVPAADTHAHAHVHAHTPALRSSADTSNSPTRTRPAAAHVTLAAPSIYHATLPPFQRMWCRVPLAPRGCTLRVRLVPVAKPVVHSRHPALASPRRAHSRSPSPASSPRARASTRSSLSGSPSRTGHLHDTAEDVRTTFTLTRMPLTPRTPSSARTSFFGSPRASRGSSPSGDARVLAHELSADEALLDLVAAARVDPGFTVHKDMSLYGSFTHTHPSPQEHAFAATTDHHALKLAAPTSADDGDAVDADLDRLSRASISTSSSPVPPSTDAVPTTDWDVLPLVCPPAPAGSRWMYVCVANNASIKQNFHLQLDCPRLDTVTGTLVPPVQRVDDLRDAHLLATLGAGHMPDVAELLVRVATRSFTVANHTDRPATLLRLPTAALRSLFAQPHRAAVHARRLLVATATVLAATLYSQASAMVRRLVLQRASITALAHVAGGLSTQQLGDILQCAAGATRTYALPREAAVTNDIYVSARQRDAHKAAEMRLGVAGAPLARRHTGRVAHGRGFVTGDIVPPRKDGVNGVHIAGAPTHMPSRVHTGRDASPREMSTMRRTDISRRLLSLAGREEHVSTGVKLVVRGDGSDAREGLVCAVDSQALRDALPPEVSREYRPAVVHVLPADAERAPTGELHHSASELASARSRTVLALAHDDLSERAMATAARSLRSGSAVVLARDAVGMQERVHRVRSARVAATAEGTGAKEAESPARALRDVSQPRDDTLLRRVSRRLLGTPKVHAAANDQRARTHTPAQAPGWSGLPRSGTGDRSSRQLWPHQPSALQTPLSASVPAKVHPLGTTGLKVPSADGASLAHVHAALEGLPAGEPAKPSGPRPHPSLASVSRPRSALQQRRAAQVPLPQEPTTIYVDRASERALAVLVRREHYAPREHVVVPAHLDLTLRAGLAHEAQDAYREGRATIEENTASVRAPSTRASPHPEHAVHVAPGRPRSPPPLATAAPVFAARAGPGLLLDTSVDSEEYSPRSRHSPRSQPSRPGSPTSPTSLPPRPLSPTGFLLPAHLRSVTRPEALSPLSAAQYASALWAARSVERPLSRASDELVAVQLSPAFSGRSHVSPPPYDTSPALLSPPLPTAVPSPLPLTSRVRRKSTAPARVDDSFYLHSRLTNVFQQWPLRHDDSSDDEEYIEKDHVARVRNENRALVALIRKKVAWMATNGLSAPSRARRRSLAGDDMDVDGLLSPSEERAIRRVMQRRGSVLAMFADDIVGSDPPVISRARKLSIVRVGSPRPDRADTASPPPQPASLNVTRVPVSVRPTRTTRTAAATLASPRASAPTTGQVAGTSVEPPQSRTKVGSTLSPASSHSRSPNSSSSPRSAPPSSPSAAALDTAVPPVVQSPPLPALLLELPPSPRAAADEPRPLETPPEASTTPREDTCEAASETPVLVASPPALPHEDTPAQVIASSVAPTLSPSSTTVLSPRDETATVKKASGEPEDSSEFFASTPTNDAARSFFHMRAAAVAAAAGAVATPLPDAATALSLGAQAAQLLPVVLHSNTATLLRALSPAPVSVSSPPLAAHTPSIAGFHPRVESPQHACAQATSSTPPAEHLRHAVASLPCDATSSSSRSSSIGPASPQLPLPCSSSTVTLPMLPALEEPQSYHIHSAQDMRGAHLPESNVPLDYGASASPQRSAPAPALHPSLTRASSEFSFSRRPEPSSPVLSNRPSLRHRSPGLALRSLGLSVLELPHPTVPCSPGLPYLSLDSSFSYSYTPTPTVPVVSPVAPDPAPSVVRPQSPTYTRPDVPRPVVPAPVTLLRRLSLGYERTPAAATLPSAPKHVLGTGSTASTRSGADSCVGVQRDTREHAHGQGLQASASSNAPPDATSTGTAARSRTVAVSSEVTHAPRGLNADLLSVAPAMRKPKSSRTVLPTTPATVPNQQNLMKQKQLRQQAYRRVRQIPLNPEQILK